MITTQDIKDMRNSRDCSLFEAQRILELYELEDKIENITSLEQIKDILKKMINLMLE